ncbi:MAG: DUF2188 domain-containing protein [Candidatus Methanomethylophilaceae archaeon]|nr:DUF2188 domain-containing protein [Candidatus Methanomethylophilaceae archaeon]
MGLITRKAKEPEQERKEAEAAKAPAGDVSGSEPSPKGNGAYFVQPHPDGGWQVKRAKAQKALKRFPTKAEADAYAKQVAKNQGTSVVRKKKDGKIQKKL